MNDSLPGYDAWLEAPYVDAGRAALDQERADEEACVRSARWECPGCGATGRPELQHFDHEPPELVCSGCGEPWRTWTAEDVLEEWAAAGEPDGDGWDD